MLRLLEDGGLGIPDEVRRCVRLTGYAVAARYPEPGDPVEEDEYQEALRLAEGAVAWVSETL